jgi:hypothetical protein
LPVSASTADGFGTPSNASSVARAGDRPVNPSSCNLFNLACAVEKKKKKKKKKLREQKNHQKRKKNKIIDISYFFSYFDILVVQPFSTTPLVSLRPAATPSTLAPPCSSLKKTKQKKKKLSISILNQ